MLRINLLPIRQLKKRATAVNQITLALIGLGCVLLILLAVGYYQSNNIKQTKGRISVLQNQKNALQKTLNDIEKLKKQTTELNRRITVINDLKKESSLTVHILDEITKTLDNERVWLDSLTQNGPSLNLKGVALDNESIAQLMNSLKDNPYFSSVTLGKSTLKSVGGRNLKSFDLACTIQHPSTDSESDSGK